MRDQVVRAVLWAVIALAVVYGVVRYNTPGPAPIDGRLAPCPATPNCVSSEADPADAAHFVAPLPAAGDAEDRCTRLFAAVNGVTGAAAGAIVGDQLRFVFHTRLFVDDVDLICRADRIDVRSSSRIGFGDFGTNRERIEAIRAAWAAAE